MKLFNIPLNWRIYVSMMGLILVSFLMTWGATYIYFRGQNEEYHTNRVKRKYSAIMSSMDYYFVEERESEFFPFYTKEFDRKIKEFSDIHSLTINIFDLNGILITSSDMATLDSSNQEKFVPGPVIEELNSGKETVITDQVKGNEDHLSVYSFLRNPDGAPVAIINMPYFFSLETTKNEAYDFLEKLSFIYIGIFLLALALGYYLSQYITKSLRKIGDKIKSIQINKKNEPLHWPSRDDIGLLVDEYNRMLKELESSAQKLAQSERETAWREMAKQVAHEIKNPLTPMKLSVQQLERSWKDKSADFETRLFRFRQTMEEQIETLSKIAGEFSNFARLPKTDIKKISLTETVETSIDLFKKTPKTKITFTDHLGGPAWVMADKNELLRVFNNIIKNGIQAIPEGKDGHIHIEVSGGNGHYQVSIADNGIGIPEDLKENMFMPSFTTKSKGMGLGLAIAKNIVSGIGGKITFESAPNQGTTFFISLKRIN